VAAGMARVVLSTEDIVAGRGVQLRDAFNAAVLSSQIPTDAAMLRRCRE